MADTIAGLKKIAEGREAEVFAHGERAVLKLYRHAAYGDSMRAEAAAMTAVHEAGGNAPAALGFEEHDGRPGLIMERIDGPDLMSEIGRKPWVVLRAGGIMGSLHASLHQIVAPQSLEPLKSRLSRHLAREPRMPAALREEATRLFADLPEGDRLCHGDFHPGNVIIARGRPIAIDWPNATRGDPTADLARTTMTFKLATLPPGSPRLIRALERVGRKVLLRGYISAYRRTRPFDATLLERWETVVAIHRLTEGIRDELPILQRFIAERTGIHAEIPADLRV